MIPHVIVTFYKIALNYLLISILIYFLIREKELNGCIIYIEKEKAGFWETIWDWVKQYRYALT